MWMRFNGRGEWTLRLDQSATNAAESRVLARWGSATSTRR
ncbi:hypothetical protein BDK92_6256 [Micromonospora pisi]|uniref:Uncharacterized protein n=1 Tax=Micromonospora pisi TaxID=589240 RepID=A0A495JTZ1_9ACTN|nr:hypothetical protein BDK92_6256 [Micromonospora pisi]